MCVGELAFRGVLMRVIWLASAGHVTVTPCDLTRVGGNNEAGMI